MFSNIRRLLLRLQGVEVLNIDKLKKKGLIVGNGCHIMGGVKIDYNFCHLIDIGDNVTIAPEVYLLAHDASTKRHLGYTRLGKITIKENVFLGARSVILPGVTIGENSIIGSGSVVANSIPSDVVAAGNPAKVIRSLEEYIGGKRKEMKNAYVIEENYAAFLNTDSKAAMDYREVMKTRMRNNIAYMNAK